MENVMFCCVEYQQIDCGYVLVYVIGVVEQFWDSYSVIDYEVWNMLYVCQCELLFGWVCQEFFDGLQCFGMGGYGILKFFEFNEVFIVVIGWQIVVVEGLLLDEVFFDYLVNCCFLVSWWICKLDQFDYFSELDLFYDLFGYVLLLFNLVFVDYMQVYGCGGMKVFGIGFEVLMNFMWLYWYMVEFGLINMLDGLCIYGVGIVSFKGELIYCLDLVVFNCIGFGLECVMSMCYCIDIYQQIYFVIESFEQLFDVIWLDFILIYQCFVVSVFYVVGDVFDSDCVFNVGICEGWVINVDI